MAKRFLDLCFLVFCRSYQRPPFVAVFAFFSKMIAFPLLFSACPHSCSDILYWADAVLVLGAAGVCAVGGGGAVDLPLHGRPGTGGGDQGVHRLPEGKDRSEFRAEGRHRCDGGSDQGILREDPYFAGGAGQCAEVRGEHAADLPGQHPGGRVHPPAVASSFGAGAGLGEVHAHPGQHQLPQHRPAAFRVHPGSLPPRHGRVRPARPFLLRALLARQAAVLRVEVDCPAELVAYRAGGLLRSAEGQ
jgi:hypothetical protein